MTIVKKQLIMSIYDDVETLEVSAIAGGNVKWSSLFGKHLGGSSKM